VAQRIVIVGGGISGLSIAHALCSRPDPADVTVLEAAPVAGGPIRSERRSGFLCEWGPHGFLDDAPATLALCARLGLDRRLLRARDEAAVRFVVRDGRLRELPSKPLAFLASDVLSLFGRLRVLGEPFVARRIEGDESVRDFAVRRVGREAADVLVDALVTGIWAGDAGRLSLQSAFPALAAMERAYGGVFRGMRATRAPRGRLTSFPNGLAELPSALASSLAPRVRLSAAASAIVRAGRGFHVETDGAGTHQADRVVVATPAWCAASLVASLDPELARFVSGIESVPVAVVHLGFPRAGLRGFGFLVPRHEHPRLLGVLLPSNIFPERAPEGSMLATAMIGGSRDPGAVELGDDALIDETIAGLASLAGVRVSPSFTLVMRHERAIPQYTLGHGERVAAIEARCRAIPGLTVAGNSYRGVSIDACIEAATTL
jgi:protoporphyrinogen/coproporphyrinogen III oxidase